MIYKIACYIRRAYVCIVQGFGVINAVTRMDGCWFSHMLNVHHVNVVPGPVSPLTQWNKKHILHFHDVTVHHKYRKIGHHAIVVFWPCLHTVALNLDTAAIRRQVCPCSSPETDVEDMEASPQGFQDQAMSPITHQCIGTLCSLLNSN